MAESYDKFLPDLPEEELNALADDIAKRGQLYPILKDSNGLVIDGRQRLMACEQAGVEPWIEQAEVDASTAEALSRTLNVKRRQLTGKALEGIATAMFHQGFKNKQIADQLNLSEQRVSELTAKERDKLDSAVADEVIEAQRQKSKGDGKPKSRRQIAEEYGVSKGKVDKVAKDPQSFKLASRKNSDRTPSQREEREPQGAAEGEKASDDSPVSKTERKRAERIYNSVAALSQKPGEIDPDDAARLLNECGLHFEDGPRLRRILGNLLSLVDRLEDMEG